MNHRGCWYAILIIVGLTLFSGVVAGEALVDLDPETDLDGSGTESDPYEIGNSSELQAMAGDLSANYTLVGDIDASNTSAWNGGAGFKPVGNATEGFSGQFDGDGYTINGLTINRSSTDAVGLFGGITAGATLSNVSLEAVDIDGGQQVGGLVGTLSDGDLTDSSVNGSVVGDGTEVGGLVGAITNGTVSNSSTTASVEGSTAVGGLVGNGTNSTLSNTFGNSSLKGTSGVGGLVGNLSDGTGTSTIELSYVAGSVDGDSVVGGAVGNSSATGIASSTYWDFEAVGLAATEGVGSGTGTPTALSTARMTGNNATATGNMDALAFYDAWIPTDSYPQLTWQFFGEMSGDGSESNRYSVDDAYGLQAIDVDLDANYTLGGSITLSETVDWNDGAGFTPIGNGSGEFTGSIDGDGQTISNLTINRSSTDNVGLISVMGETSTVSDLSIVDATVSGSTYTGTLAGQNDGNISGVRVTTDVQAGSKSGAEQSGLESVGGVVGYLRNNGHISDSRVTGTVSAPDGTGIGGFVGGSANKGSGFAFDPVSNTTATVNVSAPRGSRVGGLLGSGAAYVVVTNSSATGTVSGEENIGGLVGSTESDIFRSFATGDVTGNSTSGRYVGGLVGTTNGPTGNASAYGNVTGNEFVGGLAGRMTSFGTVDMSNLFSVGTVSGNANNGSFVGQVGTNIALRDSYFDSSTSNVSAAVGDGPDDGITGLSTADLQGSAATENTNLSFNPVWIATDGYPIHVWRVDDYELSVGQTTLNRGETTASTVTLSLSDDSTTTATEPAGYSSTNANSITVDDGGKVTAAGSGSATLTAKASGFDDTVSLSVPSTSSSSSSSRDDTEPEEPVDNETTNGTTNETTNETTDTNITTDETTGSDSSTGSETNDTEEAVVESVDEPRRFSAVEIGVGGGATVIGTYVLVVLVSRTELFVAAAPASVAKAVAAVPGTAGFLLAEPEQAAFVVGAVTLADSDHKSDDDSDVAAGETVAIDVTIENKGDIPGARVVTLTLNEPEDSATLDIPAHTAHSVVLNYETSLADAGKTLGFTVDCETDSTDIDITVGELTDADDDSMSKTTDPDDAGTDDEQTAGETVDPETTDDEEIDTDVSEDELDEGTRTGFVDRLWMQKGKILSYTAGLIIIYIGTTNLETNVFAGGLGIFLGVMALPIVRAQLPTSTRVLISRYGKVVVVIIAALFSGVIVDPAVVFERIEALFR